MTDESTLGVSSGETRDRPVRKGWGESEEVGDEDPVRFTLLRKGVGL